MAAEIYGNETTSAPVVHDLLIDGLAQGCSLPEAAMRCGLAPESGALLLQQPDVQLAVRTSHARLGDLVRMMDLAAYYAQPAESSVVDLWAWHALRKPAGGLG
jgi:hypothetical protein